MAVTNDNGSGIANIQYVAYSSGRFLVDLFIKRDGAITWAFENRWWEGEKKTVSLPRARRKSRRAAVNVDALPIYRFVEFFLRCPDKVVVDKN